MMLKADGLPVSRHDSVLYVYDAGIPVPKDRIIEGLEQFKVIRFSRTRKDFSCFQEGCKWFSHLEMDDFWVSTTMFKNNNRHIRLGPLNLLLTV
jgi:hypothetical protein